MCMKLKKNVKPTNSSNLVVELYTTHGTYNLDCSFQMMHFIIALFMKIDEFFHFYRIH